MLPKYYTVLFNRVTDAIAALDAQNYGTSRELLVRGQQEAEDLFCREPETGGPPSVLRMAEYNEA